MSRSRTSRRPSLFRRIVYFLMLLSGGSAGVGGWVFKDHPQVQALLALVTGKPSPTGRDRNLEDPLASRRRPAQARRVVQPAGDLPGHDPPGTSRPEPVPGGPHGGHPGQGAPERRPGPIRRRSGTPAVRRAAGRRGQGRADRRVGPSSVPGAMEPRRPAHGRGLRPPCRPLRPAQAIRPGRSGFRASRVPAQAGHIPAPARGPEARSAASIPGTSASSSRAVASATWDIAREGSVADEFGSRPTTRPSSSSKPAGRKEQAACPSDFAVRRPIRRPGPADRRPPHRRRRGHQHARVACYPRASSPATCSLSPSSMTPRRPASSRTRPVASRASCPRATREETSDCDDTQVHPSPRFAAGRPGLPRGAIGGSRPVGLAAVERGKTLSSRCWTSARETRS